MKNILILGDALALAVITIIGFATHGETDLSFLPRFLAIFIPLIVAWFLIAPRLGLFQPEITSNLKQLWRVPLVMLIVAPLAVAARSLILLTDIVPIFMVAFGGTSALGMMIWRGIYFVLNHN
ncbi:MAG TPA: DUF3054 domain-containing protein [Anaerolineales bacterium]|nr:DUF3054 domain-containing protein [Anaerolineales bacterium]